MQIKFVYLSLYGLLVSFKNLLLSSQKVASFSGVELQPLKAEVIAMIDKLVFDREELVHLENEVHGLIRSWT